jgi:tetratricopeptide (TPR) repeat protein/CHAT domain-containing protein
MIKFLSFFCLSFIVFDNSFAQSAEEWRSCYTKGQEYIKTGNLDSSLVYFDSAFDIAGLIYSENDWQTGMNAYYLGQIYSQLYKLNDAEKMMLLDLKVTSNISGKNHFDYGVSLGILAGLYETFGHYEQALPLHQEAVLNAEQSVGKEHSSYGLRLNNLASLYRSLQEYDLALPLYQTALLNTEKSLGKNHSNYGVILNNLALLYKSKGEYHKALTFYLEASGNTAKSLGKDHSDYGSRLNNLAELYVTMGQYEEALPIYHQALENAENSLGKEHPNYGVILSNLAGLYESLGEYKLALNLYLEALETTKRSLGKSHPNYGNSLNNLGILYKSMGQYDKALPLYREALLITENNQGKDHSDYWIRQNNLADIYESMEQYQKALPLYKESLESVEKILGKDHSDYGVVLSNLAGLYESMEMDTMALPLYLEALENAENSLGEEHSDYGSRLNNLAMNYRSLGDYEKALPLYLESLENTEKSLGKSHSKYGTVLNNLARLYNSMGHHKKALPLYLEANNILTNQIQKIFSFRSEAEKKVFLDLLSSNFEGYQSQNINFYQNNSEFLKMNLNNQLVLKGLLLKSEKNILLDLDALGDSLISKKTNELRKNKIQYTQQLAMISLNRTLNSDSLLQIINQQEASIIQEHFKHYGEATDYNRDWRKVQQKLTEHQVAIEFSHFRYYNSREKTDSIIYVAYLMRRAWKEPKMVYLFEENELKSLLDQRSPNQLYSSRGALVKNMAGLCLDSLYSLIWSKIMPSLEGVNTIYYAPDGMLHQISFAALGDSTGTLIHKYELVQLSSTYMLHKGLTSPNRSSFSLWGGINYQYDTSNQAIQENPLSLTYIDRGSRGENGTWDSLPGTQKELEDLGNLLEQKKIGFSRLSSDSATETQFKDLSGNSPKILHIATHGFFFEDPKNETPNDNHNVYVKSEDPLMRSGLLFTGANYAWMHGTNPYEQEDGILTAMEISNMDLSNTEMVVLSACETGLGDIDGNEGVYGLQRAFKMAGVDIIVMSLWQVPDKETTEFMGLFYSKWLAGQPVRTAFNATQKTMQIKYAGQPLNWAAFVLFE